MTEEMNFEEIMYHRIHEVLSVIEEYKKPRLRRWKDGQHTQTKYTSSNYWNVCINSYWTAAYYLDT
jgi:hypothetical protein